MKHNKYFISVKRKILVNNMHILQCYKESAPDFSFHNSVPQTHAVSLGSNSVLFSQTHTCVSAHAHTHTHTHMHTHVCTHAHTNTHRVEQRSHLKYFIKPVYQLMNYHITGAGNKVDTTQSGTKCHCLKKKKTDWNVMDCRS